MKAPNVFVRVKEEFEAVLHNQGNSHKTHHETHGKRDDLDEKTSMSEVKAPNVFERAKEEIEALVQTMHTKKESSGSDSCEDRRCFSIHYVVLDKISLVGLTGLFFCILFAGIQVLTQV